jgi:hypothetical protein
METKSRRNRRRRKNAVSRRLETDRDEHGDEGTAGDAPRKGEDEWIVYPELSLKGGIAEKDDGDKSGDHGNDVAEVVATAREEDSDEENPQERSKGETEDAQNEGDDLRPGMIGDVVGGDDTDDNDGKGESEGAPAQDPDAARLRHFGCSVEDEVARKTRREGVKSSAERSHGRGHNAGDNEAAQTGWHLCQDEMREDVASFESAVGGARQGWIREMQVVGVEEHADEDESAHHGQIDETAHDRGEGALLAIFRRKHALHRVLIDPVRRHREDGDADDGGPERVIGGEDVADPGGEAGLLRFGEVEEGRILDHRLGRLPALGQFAEEVEDRENEGAAEHGDLDEVRPDHRPDAPDHGIDGGEETDQGQGDGKNHELQLGRDRAFPQLPGQHYNDRRHIETASRSRGRG